MPAHGSVSSRSKVLADRRWRPVSPSMSPAPRLTSPLSMATHISNPTPRSSSLPACPAGPGREYSCFCRGVSATGPMTGSRATGIACLAGTKAVSSRHRRSPLVLCSMTHRGEINDEQRRGWFLSYSVRLWRGRIGTVALPLVDFLQRSSHERCLVVLGQAFGVAERRDALLIAQHADRPRPVGAPHASIQPERIDDPQYRLPDIV